VHEYEPCNWPGALGPAPGRIALQAYHQDQVEELPAGARRIARSDFCENAAVWYPGFALTVQGHPEFSTAYARALLQSRRGAGLSPEEADRGLATMDKKPNPEALAELIRASLHRL
jgi:GMP synthase-like glutamine amidotransferase